MEKEQILAEIRRTAAANSGAALGKARFAAETGIRETDWRGRYWARWSDALAEAGFGPNEYQAAIPEQTILACLADEIVRLRKMPTSAELALRRRVDVDFPGRKVFDRLGPKAGWARRVADAFPDRPDVLAIVIPLLAEHATDELGDSGAERQP